MSPLRCLKDISKLTYSEPHFIFPEKPALFTTFISDSAKLIFLVSHANSFEVILASFSLASKYVQNLTTVFLFFISMFIHFVQATITSKLDHCNCFLTVLSASSLHALILKIFKIAVRMILLKHASNHVTTLKLLSTSFTAKAEVPTTAYEVCKIYFPSSPFTHLSTPLTLFCAIFLLTLLQPP